MEGINMSLWNYEKKEEWDTGDKVDVVKLHDLDDVGVGGAIYLTPEIMGVIRNLCHEIKLEWQMLLCGKIVGGNAHATGYWIPKQEVSGATVKNLDVIDKEVIAEREIIATIHSHANMQVFFSTTDEEYTNMSLIQRHIVVNNDFEFTACTRWDLPNDKVCFLKAKVIINIHEVDKVEGVSNIEVKNDVGFQTNYETYKPGHALTRDYGANDFNKAMGVQNYE